MAFFGLTYCGPQSTLQANEKEPNAYNTTLRKLIPEERQTSTLKKVTAPPTAAEDPKLLYETVTPLTELKKEREQKISCKAREFTSAQELRGAKTKHARTNRDPEDRFLQPVTTNMEVGWGARTAKDEFAPPRAARTSSDETRYQEAMVRDGKV
eukprot:PhM_4_TR15548/c0_g1_i1/m.49296